MNIGRVLSAASVLLLAFASPALTAVAVPAAAPAADSGIQRDLQKRKRDLAEIQRRLKEQERKKAAALAREKSTLARLELMDRDLERLDREDRVNQHDLTKTRGRIGDLSIQAAETTRRLEAFRAELRKRLVALYRAGLGGNLLSFWLGSKTPGEVSRELKFETLLARSNEKLLKRTLGERESLTRHRRSLEAEEKRRGRILEALSRQKDRVRNQRQDRKKLLFSLRKEQALRERTIRDLKEAGANLQKTVQLLMQQEEQARWAAGRSAGQGLALLRGKLPRPVAGPVVSPFGRYRDREFNTTFENTGIQIRAATGTPVRAVADGKVRYADWFKGFGKLVILDHGGGYYSLYAQASELNVSEGDAVVAGQTIAAVGDTGSLVGEALYFEIRKDGLPVDPSLWLRR